MDFRTCEECGMVFQYPGYGDELCPACRKLVQKEFEEVNRYLIEHPGAEGGEIFKATGVPVTKISKWLREGKIEVEDATGVGVRCDMCGAPISKGKLCDECRRHLVKGFKEAGLDITKKRVSAEKTTSSKSGSGMRFLKP